MRVDTQTVLTMSEHVITKNHRISVSVNIVSSDIVVVLLTL